MATLTDLLQKVKKTIEDYTPLDEVASAISQSISQSVLPKIQEFGQQLTNQPLGDFLRPFAQKGVFGPLPQVAGYVAEKYPQTALPMAQFTSGVLRGATLGRITEKPILGEELPRSWLTTAGEMVGSTPTFSYLLGTAPVLKAGQLAGELGTKIAPTKPLLSKVLSEGAKLGLAGTTYQALEQPQQTIQNLPSELASQTAFGMAFPLAGA